MTMINNKTKTIPYIMTLVLLTNTPGASLVISNFEPIWFPARKRFKIHLSVHRFSTTDIKDKRYQVTQEFNNPTAHAVCQYLKELRMTCDDVGCWSAQGLSWTSTTKIKDRTVFKGGSKRHVLNSLRWISWGLWDVFSPHSLRADL